MISKILLAGCAVALFFVFSPDRLLLFPTRDPRPAGGAVRRTLPFQGEELECWVARTGGPGRLADRPTAPGLPPDVYVLRFYGNADRAEPNVTEEAQAWAAGRAEFWGVNFPGYGGSTGPAKLARIGPAALAAYDALARESHGRPVMVYGTSLGTTAALHVAAHRPVAGVILQNPPPLRQIILRQHGWWNLFLLAGPVALGVPSALDSVANARAVHAPAVFLLAEQDEVVRPKYQRLVVQAYVGPKQVVTQRDAGHNEALDDATTGQFNAAVRWLLNGPARGAR